MAPTSNTSPYTCAYHLPGIILHDLRVYSIPEFLEEPSVQSYIAGDGYVTTKCTCIVMVPSTHTCNMVCVGMRECTLDNVTFSAHFVDY